MTESDSLLLRAYGSSPQMKILDYLMDFPKNDFTQKEIIEALGMSKTTFYKYFDNLVDFGMIRINRKIANAKLYSIDMSSPIIQSMRKNIDYISEKIADGSLHKISVQVKHKKLKS
jgi:predicted transcriptional regulator